jgi:GDP-L-fucose synthase
VHSPELDERGGASICDLRDGASVTRYFAWRRPKTVVHLAYPGSHDGIQTSVERPADLAADLLQMDLNVIRAAAAISSVEKFVGIGSACSYPARAPVPTKEIDLWDGEPEPVNAAYGHAKRMQLVLLNAFRQQYELPGIHLILGNLYGPGDFTRHVIPSLIRKVLAATVDGGPVVVWGWPDVTRSFLYVADAAEGIVRALATYDDPEPLNLCAGADVTMAELVTEIAEICDYTGPIVFDREKPTGQQRRLLDDTELQKALGWVPQTHFRDGLKATIAWLQMQ